MKVCPLCRATFEDDMTFCANDGEVLQVDKTSLVGQKLDNQYYIESLLGKGGMGSVYKARHVLLGDLVALKVLSPEMREDEAWLKRFQREGQAARMFRHPNAVTVHDLRTTPDGLMYLVMEYIEGDTLAEEIRRRGSYQPGEACALLEPIMGVLHAAHSTGVVHRDLKPDNIMIGRTANGLPDVKLLDLGVAKVLPKASDNVAGADSVGQAQLTAAGQLLGTPFYMSPEQWGQIQRDGHDDIDGRADLYSLAVVIYEMVAGYKPFYGGSLYEICDSHLHRMPTPLATLRPDIAPAFSQAVERALSKDRNDRQPNVQVFADELHNALMQPVTYGGPAVYAPPPPTGYDPSQTVVDNAGGHARATQVGETPETAPPYTVVGGGNAPVTAATIVDTGGAAARATLFDNHNPRPTAVPQEPPRYAPPATADTVQRQNLPATAPAVGTAPSDNLAPTTAGVAVAADTGTGGGFPVKLLAIPALLLALVVGGGGIWYAFLRGPAATNGPATPTAPAKADIMRYWLEVTTPAVKGQPEVAPRRVADGPFLSGQDFRFYFSAPTNGYLYIVGPGENNAPTTFLTAQPVKESGVTSNRLNAGVTYAFPNGAGNWFSMDKKAGTEVFTIIFSQTPLTTPAFLANPAGEGLNLADWDDFRTKYSANKAVRNVSGEGSTPFVGLQAPQPDAPIMFEVRLEHQ